MIGVAFLVTWALVFGAAVGIYYLYAYFVSPMIFNRNFRSYIRDILQNTQKNDRAVMFRQKDLNAMIWFLHKYRYSPRLKHSALMLEIHWTVQLGNIDFVRRNWQRINLAKVRRNVFVYVEDVLTLYRTGQVQLAEQMAGKLEESGNMLLPLVRGVGRYYKRDFAGSREELLKIRYEGFEEAASFNAWTAYYLALLSVGEERNKYLEKAVNLAPSSSIGFVAKALLRPENAALPEAAPPKETPSVLQGLRAGEKDE